MGHYPLLSELKYAKNVLFVLKTPANAVPLCPVRAQNVHPPQVPCENWLFLTLFPLSVWQEVVFHARQTC